MMEQEVNYCGMDYIYWCYSWNYNMQYYNNYDIE